MIISVTSPRSGTGRSLFATSLAQTLATRSNSLVNLVDLNSNHDQNYYLNKAPLSRSLDDFCAGEDANMFSLEKPADFARKCTKPVNNLLAFTDSNTDYSLTSEKVDSFLSYSRAIFRHTIIDCRAGEDMESQMFFEQSDYVLVVVNQDVRSLEYIKHELAEMYRPYGEKMIFIANKYLDQIGKVKFNCTDATIKSYMLQSGLGNRVFRLGFSAIIMNDANERTIPLFITNRSDEMYFAGIDKIVSYMSGV